MFRSEAEPVIDSGLFTRWKMNMERKGLGVFGQSCIRRLAHLYKAPQSRPFGIFF